MKKRNASILKAKTYKKNAPDRKRWTKFGRWMVETVHGQGFSITWPALIKGARDAQG